MWASELIQQIILITKQVSELKALVTHWANEKKQQLDSGGERTKQYEQSAGDMLSAVRRINLLVEEQQRED